MNELENLLRRELHARVAAAESGAADEQPSALLADLDDRIRRARIRRRWTVSALTAVATAAAVALPLTVPPAGPPQTNPLLVGPPWSVPLTDTAATPRGWAPVAFGDAQISVPAAWLVASTPQCGPRVPGYVVLGNTSTNLVGRNPLCGQAANMAAIQVLPSSQGQTGHRSGQINGIPVLGVRPPARGYVSLLAPTLHVLVTARGPLAPKVLGTLTRSPLSVVLGARRQFPVPRSWHWHSFRGIRFAAPGSWAFVRNGYFTCPFGLSTKAVILIPPAHSRMPTCGVEPGTAGVLSAHFGVTAAAGPYPRAGTAGFEGCGHVHGLRFCYSAPPDSGGVLGVAVFVPGRQRATLVRIGMAGDGVTARTIFESIGQR
jgi:hypothetical protein